ncbi:acetolactate synthase III, valine-sensitive, regulatory (small) subunit [Campylobacter subantarcticus LMG 24377]|uniref:Acetolactate synthase small subunit n=2 Tax=Campylobacter subantarcticus TaxID=497724 RepID=A0A0A8H9E8_9BACT|nr:acetolactate synthase small subunit [Campylobacter subantarcticus]EAJ1261781.1 acetolactate synthase small subunit [Campylobacter lari]AJC90711.1 acetolactate synthase III, valine-sensitive, regulatory (small) subunit [Campylobacter subantarcticus LMG 24374]AJC92473.1 acetolactate synthase III, valine-sensitive, regulatory (small) subunit [Campylobacter subantarcticus LMG 24377]EAL3939523.1 acetolactate synthase small subunit [Campylobacter lari]MPC00046.1 acetolactate synthase small subuni
MKRRVISVIVLNEHGVLSRVVGLFSGRGYNIESLTVAPLDDKDFSRINIVTLGDEKVFEQIIKQLHKLIPTYKVIDSSDFIEKETALVKIALSENFAGLDTILKAYNGSVTYSDDQCIIVMTCDDACNIDNFLKTMKKYNPISVVRSGSILMEVK